MSSRLAVPTAPETTAPTGTALASPDDAPVVDVDGLAITLRRGRRLIEAVRGVDLRICRGEIVGLVGESGSGKSVLGMSLLGLLPESSQPKVEGKVVVAGVDMLNAGQPNLRDLRRGSLGAVFQDPMTSLDPTMRIGSQIREVADTDAEAIQLLNEVGVPEPARRLHAYPHELSGGLRQRVMIAMAVAGEPKLIVADEPTTALDVTIQAQILDLVSRLRANHGCSVLFITHDLGVASQIADRIAVLYGGRIAEIGPTETLLHEPHHPYTAGLLRSRLDLTTDKQRPVPALEGEPPDPDALPPGCPFAPRCSFTQPECIQGLPELVGGPDHQDACVRSRQLNLRARRTAHESWSPPKIDTDSPPALVVRKLVVSGGRRQVLRKTAGVQILYGVDLTVQPGEAVALVGESGSGKTTLLRAIAGLMKHETGELQLAPGPSPQMVFQDPGASLTSWLTVGELIEDRLRRSMKSHKQRRQRVAETLVSVGLSPEAAAVRPSQLSGGQRQRVALARAIVVPPTLLLCDEPTSSLDVSVAANVLNLIGMLRRELKMAVLFVTHDLAIARLIADRIAVMYLGRIVETGPAEAVLAAPVHPYTRALITSIPRPGTVRVKLAGEPPSLYSPPTGCPFHPRCPEAREACATRKAANRAIADDPSHTVDCVLAELD